MHKIGFVVSANFQVMGFAALTAFEIANLVLGEKAYGSPCSRRTAGW